MLVSVLLVLLFGGALFYVALIGAFSYGFRRVFSSPLSPSSSSEAPSTEAPFVSVVIAARDEVGHIERCLDAVLQSTYPSHRYEVIVVDDFSQDATAQRVRQFMVSRQPAATGVAASPSEGKAAVAEQAPPPAPRMRLLQMHHVADESTGHKREALNHGISAARGPLILTTDADCTPSPGWIGSMTAPLQDEEVAFVAGPVRYRLSDTEPDGRKKSFAKRFFEKAQALEFLALQAVGAGTIGLGRPTICNSANVAYRQSVYETLYRPETLGAADDETLIQRIVRETPFRVAFCPAPEARVETPPAEGVLGFLRQRQRWASMTPRYPDTGFTLALAGLYGFYLALLAALLLSVWVPALLLPVTAAFGLKLVAEAMLLVPTCRRFEQSHLLQALVPFQPLHALYVAFIGAAGPLGTTRWKGRVVE